MLALSLSMFHKYSHLNMPSRVRLLQKSPYLYLRVMLLVWLASPERFIMVEREIFAVRPINAFMHALNIDCLITLSSLI